MSEQQDALFSVHVSGVDRDHALARFGDPETSHQADAKLRTREGTPTEIRKGTHRHRALFAFYLESRTADEIQTFTQVDGIWKRVSDLKNQGLIEATGSTRKSRQGREQDVYRITQAGRDALEQLR